MFYRRYCAGMLKLPRRPDPLELVALGLLATAITFAVIWAASPVTWLDALAPNAIAESIGIGLALTVIDRVLRRRDRARLEPLVQYAMDTLGISFRVVTGAIALDYVQAHSQRKHLPKGATDLFNLWLAEEANEDTLRSVAGTGGWRSPVTQIVAFAEKTFRLTE